jgi:F0F1-type ATP synthase membrane subunit c/vacuolar-type H+-ATPase subunit K
MKLLKKFYAWEMRQAKKPEVMLAAGIAIGVAIGIGMDNIGAGIAIGVAIGIGMQASAKKALKKENDTD